MSVKEKFAITVFLLATFAILLSGCGGQPSTEQVQTRVNPGTATAIANIPTKLADAAPTTSQPVLRAERFEVVDKNGKIRALLTTLEDGRPTLALVDESGEFRVWLFLSQDGSPKLVLTNKPFLVLTDAAGEFRLVLRLDQDGSPSLGLTDATGKFRSVMRLESDGSPVLLLNDNQGNVIWSTPGSK